MSREDQGELLRDAFRKLHNELHDTECLAKEVNPPSYKIQTIGGGFKTFYHDEESIKDASDEEKQAWIVYQKCLKGLQTEPNEQEAAREREYKERRLAELPSFEAYNKRVGISELALRLMFIEAQYLLGRALTWPTS